MNEFEFSFGKLFMHLDLVFLALPILLLPSIIAAFRNHPHKAPIIIINIFGGMVFGIGWVIALAWCFILPKQTKESGSVTNEIEKLHELKTKGILTEEEFHQQKQKILSN